MKFSALYKKKAGTLTINDKGTELQWIAATSQASGVTKPDVDIKLDTVSGKSGEKLLLLLTF